MASPAPAEHPRDVLLVPGFLDVGGSLEPLAHRLEHAGHRVHRANLGRNIDCTEQMTQRLEARVADVADTVGSPCSFWSVIRGAACWPRWRRCVTRSGSRPLIAVGSPLASPHDITIVLRLVKLGLRRLSRLGVPGLLDDCLFGSCCDRFYRDLASPPPAGVELISIGSPSDGMVASSATRDPDARDPSPWRRHTPGSSSVLQASRPSRTCWRRSPRRWLPSSSARTARWRAAPPARREARRRDATRPEPWAHRRGSPRRCCPCWTDT